LKKAILTVTSLTVAFLWFYYAPLKIQSAEALLLDSSQTDTTLIVDSVASLPLDTMILIPAGEYLIGDDEGLPDQKPAHKVKLDAFFIDAYEVTNSQYAKFLEDSGHRLPLFWLDTTLNRPYMPVTGVSWDDAVAYCQWAGKRLPTEAEWETAARGGLTEQEYPWEGSIKKEKANYRDDPDKKPSGLKEVGQYPPNGYGLYDMSGNVWEWTADLYSKNSSARVLRGGSWNYTAEFQKCAYRNRALPDLRTNYIGFRCVKSAK
jgi:iron(II)-dependent oxidoreductase